MRTANPEYRRAERPDHRGGQRTFSRLGLAASSTDDFCKEVGISPGRLYYSLRKVVRMIVSPWMVDAAETSLKRSKRL
jgi:hypothetical protein